MEIINEPNCKFCNNPLSAMSCDQLFMDGNVYHEWCYNFSYIFWPIDNKTPSS